MSMENTMYWFNGVEEIPLEENDEEILKYFYLNRLILNILTSLDIHHAVLLMMIIL